MKPDGTIGTAGKGPLIQEEISATLGTTQDQYLFVPLHGKISPPSMQVTSRDAESGMGLNEKLWR